MQWFEKCKCGEYLHVRHNCIYNDKDMKIESLEKEIKKLKKDLNNFIEVRIQLL